MRSLFIAAALMMTSLITATAQESTVQINANGANGTAQYVIKGVPYMTAPANPIIMQLGKQPGFIPVAVAELQPDRVIYTGMDGRIVQTSLAEDEVIIGKVGGGVEKRKLIAGDFLTFSRPNGTDLRIDADPQGGDFSGGLLKFNVHEVEAADFTSKGGGRYYLNLNGGSYFRIMSVPSGSVLLDEFRDLTVANEYSEGSLILIEVGDAAASFTVKGDGTLSAVGNSDYGLTVTESNTNNMNKDDIFMFIRTASGWLEVSKKL
jgi:hypothetical protein